MIGMVLVGDRIGIPLVFGNRIRVIQSNLIKGPRKAVTEKYVPLDLKLLY